MRLKSIRLKNIRSYLDEKIEFPHGSVLLSGNIGCGKSTVLLAIDFSLFGLRKGDLSGSALLRNGEDTGSVELDFELDGKNITIKRVLKRARGTVSQDEGFLAIDGRKAEGTAIELKQGILDLFNYPKELLSKNKALVYRYTVYTPQEEMKQILLGDKEQRLDTLRKVFGIDKYKRIVENCSVLISSIKEKKKELAGKSFDAEEKQAQRELVARELLKSAQKLGAIAPKLKESISIVKEKKAEIKKEEERLKEYIELKKDCSIRENDLKNKREQLKRNKEKITAVANQIGNLEKEQAKVLEENFANLIKNKKELTAQKSIELEKLKENLHEYLINVSLSKDTVEKITSLDICPKCKQKVNEEHKKGIVAEEEMRISNFNKEISSLQTKKEEAEKEFLKLEDDLEELRKKENKNEVCKVKAKNLEDKKLQLKDLDEVQAILKKEVASINLEMVKMFEKIEAGKDIDLNYQKLREELEPLESIQMELEVGHASMQAEVRAFESSIKNLDLEIKRKEGYKKTLAYLATFQEWLEVQFINMVKSMERNIMLNVHSDFNSLFEKWFNMLMDNNTISVKLDEEFSPLIQQNGYDIDYSFLSGGEKTATALAYRLALNQVINSMMSTIKTNGLLILDEPTDGFSSEQLERIKDILEEINIPQVIIVSHENKIESFVDSIIRIAKEEHVSKII